MKNVKKSGILRTPLLILPRILKLLPNGFNELFEVLLIGVKQGSR